MRSFREELGAGEWGTKELTNKYKKETPGQKIEESKIDILRNMMAGVDKIDTSGAAYTKLKNYMKSLDDKNLQMIAKANIKFMSNLANTELKSRKTQKEFAEKVEYFSMSELKDQLKKEYGSKNASLLKIVKIKSGVSIQTPSGQELERYHNVPKLGYTLAEKNLSDKEKDIEDLMKMIKNPDPKRVKEYGGKDEYVSMLKDKVKKLMKETYIGEDVNEEKNSLESELGGTEEQRVQLLKLYGKAFKAFPGSPKQKKINAEIENLRKKMKKDVKEETLNEAAPIRRLLATNNLYGYFSGTPKVTGLNPNDVIGKIWGLKSVKGYSEFYLWNFDAYDKSVTKHIKLKSGEKLFRYVSQTTATSNLKPMIKVNVAKSLVYFLKQDENYEYIDPPEFESKGVKFNGIQLTEDGAKGLDISNWTEIVRESNKLTDNFERQLFERLAQDDAYADRDYDVVKKAWDKAKDKNKVIQKYGLKTAFSNLRGGEIKLGISNELRSRPKRKIAALDGDKLIYITGWPMKIHFHEEVQTESYSETYDRNYLKKLLQNPKTEMDEEEALDLFQEIESDKMMKKMVVANSKAYKEGQNANSYNENPYGKSKSDKGSFNFWMFIFGFDDAN
jgi:hypothetical protein